MSHKMQYLPNKHKKKFKLLSNMQTHEFKNSSASTIFILDVYRTGKNTRTLVLCAEFRFLNMVVIKRIEINISVERKSKSNDAVPIFPRL